MRFWLLLVVVLVSLASCRKEEGSLRTAEPRFVPGQLIGVMDSGQTLESTVALFNALSLPLMEVRGFHFRSPRPVEEVR